MELNHSLIAAYNSCHGEKCLPSYVFIIKKNLVKLQYVIIYYGEMMPLISFHHSRQIYYGEMIHYFTIVDYYILQFDKFLLSYKDIRRKAFFTMVTLLMPLLENVKS